MSKAILRGVRLSPKKARLVARQIQGMNAEYALAYLEFTPNKAARIIYKVLASAIANGDYQPEEVMISSCRIDEGAVLKRFRPRARGSASKIRKPTAHVFVEVGPDTVERRSAKKIATEPAKVVKKAEAKPSSKKAATETTSTEENNNEQAENTMKKEEQ